MRVLLMVFSLLISMESEAEVITDDRVIMSKENAENVVCGVRGIGFLYGYEEELLECVSSHLKKGYMIDEKNSTYDMAKLKASLAKIENAETN